MAIPFSRYFWLVLVPTACASAGWVFLKVDFALDAGVYPVLCLMPLAGLVPVLGYAAVFRDPAALLPNVPYAVAAAGFAINWLQVRSLCLAEPECNPIPVVGLLAGLALPLLALGGGLMATATAISGRTRPGPVSR